jgi:hypothetical protein
MQTIEETLFANRKTKEKILQAINQIPLYKTLTEYSSLTTHCKKITVIFTGFFCWQPSCHFLSYHGSLKQSSLTVTLPYLRQ